VDAWTKARLLAHVVHWRLTWSRHDLDHRPAYLKNPKFVSARHAVATLPDDAVCFSSGMAGNGRCSIFFWALRDRFQRSGHPRNLTWITVGAQGGRGKAPGTLEEICLPGLLSRAVVGHLETKKALLRLADAGHCTLHTLPQGQQTFILEAMGRGEDSVFSRTAVGTFLDPRVGTGSLVWGTDTESFISVEGDGLRFRMPRFRHAFFSGSHADDDGNVYMRNATTLTEVRESVRAARAAGGKVYAAVASVIPPSPGEIYVPASDVDAIVVNPWNEQTGSVQQRSFWPMFTTRSDLPAVEAIARLKFANEVVRITPKRGPVENALARLGARTFCGLSRPGALVNIGVGLPEEVCRVVFEAGLTDDVTFMSETGVLGGLPAPGVFFGAAVCPREMVTSTEVFRRAYRELDTTILGLLQADSEGNVNVSKRGPRALDYVGPGGLPDLTAAARNILFVGTWQAGGRIEIRDGRMAILQRGKPKFTDRVDEVTFCGRRAVEAGKNVRYVTNVGVFRLTARGMELESVMPGIDVRRDVLEGSPMKVVAPEGDVPALDPSVTTGRGFGLSWPG
jgi:propionate CoA-transferase